MSKLAVFNQVSECCHKEITSKHVVEFPMGGTYWGIPTKHDVCIGCGLDASPVDQCGICGVVGCLEVCEVTADISEVKK